MFKKNPNRPPMVISLKRAQGGYKVIPNEGHAIFQVKRIIRTMYRRTPIPIKPTSFLKVQTWAFNKMVSLSPQRSFSHLRI